MRDTLDIAFDEAFNQIAQLYDDDALDECIKKARKLFDDSALPRYHRMSTLILLGFIVGEWYEADELCDKANVLWQTVRRWHRVSEDDKVDRTLQELRESIAEEEPPGYDYTDEEAEIKAIEDQMNGIAGEAEGAEKEEGEDLDLPLRTAEESAKHENEQQESSGGKDGDSSNNT